MKYVVLSSGSKGNSTALVNDKNEILLIDCGLSLKELNKRFEQAKLSMNQVKAVIITHMHKDHCACMCAFSSNILYAHKDSLLSIPKANQLEDYSFIEILDFKLLILPMSHDIEGTIGFLITYKDEKMAYLTDTGYVHVQLQRLINNCEYYVIESNHDPRMLMLSNRPLYLKQRILSIKGHLSNQDCALTIANVMGPNTKEICFLHRSLETNTEELIMQTFYSVMKHKEIDVQHILIKIAKQDCFIKGGVEYESQIQK